MEEYNIKEETYKCSKCGLCQCVCPLYLATKNEMYLSRGRYIVINNFFNNNKKFSKDFIKTLDICLNCNLCKDFCPSSIDAYKIFTKLKSEYKCGFLNFSSIYKLIMYMHKIKSTLYNVFHINILFKNSLYSINIKRKKNNYPKKAKGKIIFFEGCYNRYINPSDKNAAENIIESSGFEIIKSKFFCCGYPYINEGNFNKFIENGKKFINSVPDSCDYIVFSCDSCFDTIERLKDFLPEAEKIMKKIIRFDKFLEINNFNPVLKDNVIYYKPLIRKEKFNLDIPVLNKKGACSLMENFILIKHKKITNLLLKNLFYTKEDTQNKTVFTTCLISKLGLQYGFKKLKNNSKVLSFSELIHNSMP